MLRDPAQGFGDFAREATPFLLETPTRQKIGFRVQVLEGYGTLQLREGHLGFLAEKL